MIPAAQPLIGDEERAAVDRVLRSGMIAGGPEVAAFEQEFGAQLVGQELRRRQLRHRRLASRPARRRRWAGRRGDPPVVHVRGDSQLGRAHRRHPGVRRHRARPVLPRRRRRRAAVTERTKGIMPVHLYGHPADMTAAERGRGPARPGHLRGCSPGARRRWQGRPVALSASFGMFSLYPTKNMTSGEGGMVSCADAQLARMVRLLRNQGMERRYENEVIGFNARMTDLHAAIGRAQLAKLPGWTQQRQHNAKFLDANLSGVVVPPVADGAVHVYHQYTIRVPDDRDGFARALAGEHGIGTGVYYPIPMPPAAVLPGSRWTSRKPSAPPARHCHCQSTPPYPRTTWTIAAAVNAVARAGA